MLKVAYLGSSASPHNQRWTSFLSRHFDLEMFSMEEAEIDDVKIHHFARPTRIALDYLLARRRIASAMEEFGPDIIHAHRITSYGYIAAGAVRKLRRGGKVVSFILSVWGEDVFSFPRKSPLHRVFTASILGKADQILSTSHIMKEETLRYVSPAREIYVTPFGVDTGRFVPPARTTTAAVRKAGNLTEEPDPDPDPTSPGPARQSEVVIGTVKKLRGRYGVDILIRAIAIAVRELAPELILRGVIVGEGPQEQELKNLTEELGVAGLVSFTGRVPHAEVPAVLSRLDIFAALSLSDDESFGVAMIEASAMALPVISTRVGGIPEVVQHERTGLLVPPGDVAAAAAAIVRMARDTVYRKTLGENGRRFVQETYDWSNTAARMKAIYEEVHDRSHR